MTVVDRRVEFWLRRVAIGTHMAISPEAMCYYLIVTRGLPVRAGH
jgi:hypothetical protein